MTTFENAKVGDRVWSFELGWGTILKFSQDQCDKDTVHQYTPLLIYIQFDRTGSYLEHLSGLYDMQGRRHPSMNQSLFWNEVKFEIPSYIQS